MTPLERFDRWYRWLYRCGLGCGIAMGLHAMGAMVFGWPGWGWWPFFVLWLTTYTVWRRVTRRRLALVGEELERIESEFEAALRRQRGLSTTHEHQRAMVKTYEPAENAGWQERYSADDEVRRWRVRLSDGLYLKVTTGFEGLFIMGRVNEREHNAVPTPGDLERVQRDFGVLGWRVGGVLPCFGPRAGTGECLLAWAVEPEEVN